MAESILPQSGNGEALEPREYLRWVLSLERASGLPEDVRAYLVSTDPVSGKRRLSAVEGDASVLNIERDLLKHLADGGYGREFFERLTAFCLDRLDVGLNDLPGEAGERGEIARTTAVAIDDIAEALEGLDMGTAASVLVSRIRQLACVVLSAVDHDDTLEGLRERAGVAND